MIDVNSEEVKVCIQKILTCVKHLPPGEGAFILGLACIELARFAPADDEDEKIMRKLLAAVSGENAWDAVKAMVAVLQALATTTGICMAQLAIAVMLPPKILTDAQYDSAKDHFNEEWHDAIERIKNQLPLSMVH